MRTKRYKLIYFYGCNYQGEYQTPAGWELYDMKKDPQETKNIYEDPKNAKLISSLKNWMAKLRKKVGDDGSHYPACEEIVQEFWDYSEADQEKARKISGENSNQGFPKVFGLSNSDVSSAFLLDKYSPDIFLAFS